jgi:hypothetical protein
VLRVRVRWNSEGKSMLSDLDLETRQNMVIRLTSNYLLDKNISCVPQSFIKILKPNQTLLQSGIQLHNADIAILSSNLSVRLSSILIRIEYQLFYRVCSPVEIIIKKLYI